jgi:sugar phosphate isomerase/epimerase
MRPMRVAASTLLHSRLSLDEACDRLRTLDVDAVDIGAMAGWAHLDPESMVGAVDATVDRLDRILTDTGLDPVALNARLGGGGVEAVAALTAVAAGIGAPVVTLPSAGADADLDADLDRFRSFVDAAHEDVTLTVETHHGLLTEDPAVAERYAALPGVGLTLDPGHYAVGPHWDRGYGDLVPEAAHVHLRQAGATPDAIQRPPDDGRIDVGGFLDELRAAGYDGAVTVEYIDSLDGCTPDEAERWAGAMIETVTDHLDGTVD